MARKRTVPTPTPATDDMASLKAARTPHEFGAILAAIRLKLGLTIAQCGDRCEMGVQHWSDIESGRVAPGYNLLRKIQWGLKLKGNDLLPPMKEAPNIPKQRRAKPPEESQ